VQCAYVSETRVHNESSKHNSCRVNLQHSESVLIKFNSVSLYLTELENYNWCLHDRNIVMYAGKLRLIPTFFQTPYIS
jgi:hypothetical protein